MIRRLNEKVTSIKDYAHTHKDKVLLVDIDNKIIVLEGDDSDWEELQLMSDDMNSKGGNFRVTVTPKSYMEIQTLDWKSYKDLGYALSNVRDGVCSISEIFEL